MAKYVDVEALYCADCEYHGNCDHVTCDVKSFPKADVVEVVRCKDCKHFVSPQGRPVCGNFFGLEFPEENGNDFCAYGVRRDNAGGANSE